MGDDLRGVLAPFTLVRIAGLPYQAMRNLSLTKTSKSISEVLNTEECISECRDRLDKALFNLIPKLDDNAVGLRRSVLKLKRNIHNGRKANIDQCLMDELAVLLGAEDADLLRRWSEAHEQLEQTLLEAGKYHSEEMQTHLRKELREPLKQETFKKALSFASAGVAAHAKREKKLPTKVKPDNFERSLFGYIIRAAAKTSPFSSFMSMTAVPIDFSDKKTTTKQAGFSLSQPEYQLRTRLNRGIPFRIFKHAMLFLQRHNESLIYLNSSVKLLDDHRITALCDRDMVLLGRPWTESRMAVYRLNAKLTQALMAKESSGNWQQWIDYLVEQVDVSEDQANMLLEKFIRKGLLESPPLSNTFDPMPELGLVEFMAESNLETVRLVGQLVAEMINICEEVTYDKSDQRANKVKEIAKLENEALALLGVTRYPRYHNTALEDCWFPGGNAHIASEDLSQLSGLESFLSTQVIYSPQYLRLRDHFVEFFGESGICTDVSGFLTDVGEKLVDITEYGAAQKNQKEVVAPSGARFGVTAQIQLAVQEQGPPLIVVNRVFDRPVWLASRFAFGDNGEKSFLQDSLTQWLNELSAPAEPVDLLINGHSNDLQAHPKLTKRAISWPFRSESTDNIDLIDIDTLTLTHDPVSGLLHLFDQHNKELKLVYTGSTFPTPAWGISYALILLTQPFTLSRPNFRPPVLSSEQSIIHNPRIVNENVILSREFWWVKSDYLLENWFSEKGVDQMLAVKRDCIDKDLPSLFFVKSFEDFQGAAGIVPHNALATERKPLWIDIGNPFSLALMEKLASNNEWLSLTEALPNPEELWLDIDGDKHVTELQVEMNIRAE